MPPTLETRACQQVGPPIFTHPLRAMEGGHRRTHPPATTAPRPGRAVRGHGNTHSGTGEEAHHTRGGEQQRRRYNIATSRTGTATWKRVRAQALKQAIDNNITHCASCGVGLDYEYTRRPNSAEVDHVIPYSKGGTDTLGNTTVICRWCNQRKGNGRNLTVPQPKTIEPGTSIEW